LGDSAAEASRLGRHEGECCVGGTRPKTGLIIIVNTIDAVVRPNGRARNW